MKCLSSIFNQVKILTKTITKKNAFKINRSLFWINKLSMGRFSYSRYFFVIASKLNGLNYSYDEKQNNFFDFCFLLMKIEH